MFEAEPHWVAFIDYVYGWWAALTIGNRVLLENISPVSRRYSVYLSREGLQLWPTSSIWSLTVIHMYLLWVPILHLIAWVYLWDFQIQTPSPNVSVFVIKA